MMVWSDFTDVDDLELRLVASNSGLRMVKFPPFGPVTGDCNPNNDFLLQAAEELRNYFAGILRVFRTPLDPQGTGFQLDVWKELGENSVR